MSLAVSAIEGLRRSLAYPDWRGKVLYGVLRGIFALAPIRRKLVLEALRQAFPEKDEAWRTMILSGLYSHFAWMIVEFLAAVNDPSLVCRMVEEVENREILDDLLAQKKGLFFLTGHFSNWEICGAWFPQSGYPMKPVARDADNADFAALIDSYRTRLGEITQRKGAKGTLHIIREARKGSWIGLLADQDAGPDGIPVWFLHRHTTMVAGPAVLALTARLPLIPAYCVRIAPFRYKMCVLPPLSDGTEGRTDENVNRLTQKANAALEEMVRRAPEQWFWFHRRWKTDPDRPGVKAQ